MGIAIEVSGPDVGASGLKISARMYLCVIRSAGRDLEIKESIFIIPQPIPAQDRKSAKSRSALNSKER